MIKFNKIIEDIKEAKGVIKVSKDVPMSSFSTGSLALVDYD